MGRPNLDMYRRVPADLLEGTKRGSTLSFVSIFTMVVLFLFETKAFFSSRLVAEMSLDDNEEAQLRINFNITMMDMKCEYATIDFKSDLGTAQNITQHINKWNVDAEGVRQMYASRNKDQHDIVMYDESILESIEELHEDGEDAIPLDEKTLQFARDTHPYVFVDFFASWCSHCQQLAPTWETLAEVMDVAAEETLDEMIDERDHHYTDEEYIEAKKVELPVFIGKVDCVDHKELCQQEGIRAYPTLRLFVDGKRHAEYTGHRTVVEMTHWLMDIEKKHEELDVADKKLQDLVHEIAHERTIEDNPERTEWAENLKNHRHTHSHKPGWNDADHPGCRLAGYLNVDRSPGNFHIIARSKKHTFDPLLTNVSHEVHHLSFGLPLTTAERLLDSNGVVVPPGFIDTTRPMDGNVYVTHKLHEAHHHYIKVITTNVDDKDRNYLYQLLPSSQLSLFPSDTVPEAKFVYDLSPISISYKKSYLNWYDYITSVMAIVGGTFTIVGLLESGIHAATSKKNR